MSGTPADSKRADVGCGYASLAAAVHGFRETGCLPPGLKCEDWDEGDGYLMSVMCRGLHFMQGRISV